MGSEGGGLLNHFISQKKRKAVVLMTIVVMVGATLLFKVSLYPMQAHHNNGLAQMYSSTTINHQNSQMNHQRHANHSDNHTVIDSADDDHSCSKCPLCMGLMMDIAQFNMSPPPIDALIQPHSYPSINPPITLRPPIIKS